ncbi:MAG: RNA-binding S4 domain-containing protein [Clostridia bacterium]|nr:RNA-binding S4 domain-containing protein [Clostridia bacterium]
MRLDKFLKVSRLIKRRTVATDMCWAGRVRKNGAVARPSAEVQPGDEVEIDYGTRVLTVRVKVLQDSMPAQLAHIMYEVVREVKRPDPDLG